MLVDDAPAVAEIFSLILEDAGAQVIAVSSSAAALKTLGPFVLNMLISDIRLPDIDVCSLLARVKAFEGRTRNSRNSRDRYKRFQNRT